MQRPHCLQHRAELFAIYAPRQLADFADHFPFKCNRSDQTPRLEYSISLYKRRQLFPPEGSAVNGIPFVLIVRIINLDANSAFVNAIEATSKNRDLFLITRYRECKSWRIPAEDN